MTINFDPTRKRATDMNSGLAVEWVRDEPPMERQTHFKIMVGGRSLPFTASYDHGDKKIREGHANLTPGERFLLTTALKEKNYYAQNIVGEFDRTIFVELWQRVVSHGLDGIRVAAHYSEFRRADGSDTKEWCCEGQASSKS